MKPLEIDKLAKYDTGITNVPASFVTPIVFVIRNWIENKSEWKDRDNISKIVDELIFFKKIKEAAPQENST